MKYDFDQKHKWRAWVWNNVVKMLKVPVEEAVVLYLPGHGDFDRKEALERGFNPDNLIGVERDPVIIKKLRAKGVNVIDADVLDIIEILFKDEKKNIFDVILLDFMGGLSKKIYASFSCFYSGLLNYRNNFPVIMLNLLRGRDNFKIGSTTKTSEINGLVEYWSGTTIGASNNLLPLKIKKQFSKIKKHRGRQFYFAHCFEWFVSFSINEETSCSREIFYHKYNAIKKCFTLFYLNGANAFYSYKSDAGSMRFDTVVFRVGFNLNKYLDKSLSKIEKNLYGNSVKIKIKAENKLAAAKAIRTARLNKIQKIA